MDVQENLRVDVIDSVIPADAGIQMFRAMVDRWSCSEKHCLSDQVRILIPPAWVRRFNRLDLPRPVLTVKGKWKYFVLAVDKQGNTIDFLLTAERDKKAALRFLTKAIDRSVKPSPISINKSGANTAAI